MQYCQRLLEAPLQSRASKNHIRLVFGARQTGKSTLLKHISPSNATVLDLQDSERRLEFERRPRSFTELLLDKKGKKNRIIVDEIQKVPALLEEIQWLFDRHPSRYEFFLTGSSARKLRRSSANLLPGRSHIYTLSPLMQAERGIPGHILPFKSDPAVSHFPKKTLNETLLYGSLPGIQKEKPAAAKRTLNGYAELYLEEEIRREGLVRDIGAFSRFLELVALESGQIVNLSKLSNQSGIPISSLKLFYQVLVDTFVGYWLEPFTMRSRKRILSTPRFYLFDVGVRNAAARLDLSDSLLKIQGGPLLEQWVGLELIHRIRFLGPGFRLGFWRTVGGAEVDFVVQTPKDIIPIEVKWTDKPTPSDARHLHRFLDDVPKAKKGLVVCRVREPRQLSDRVKAIPWNTL